MNELRNYGIEVKTIMAVYLCLFCSLNKVYEQMSITRYKRDLMSYYCQWYYFSVSALLISFK